MVDAIVQAMIPPQEKGSVDCDIAIVGSGAGGSTAAHELAAAGLSVIVIEDGDYIPAAEVPPSATESFQTMWRNGGLTAAMGKPPVSYAEGRCVGGSTEINSAIFQRPDAALLAEWAETYKIADFSEGHLAAHFDWAAEAVNASLTEGSLGQASEIMKTGGEKLGWKVTPLERAQKGCIGTNLCSFGCPTGGKQSMTRSLLPRAMAGRCRIMTNSRVIGIRRQDGRVTGLSIRSRSADGRTVQRHVAARRAVFLCAGAVHTPALLQASNLAGRAIGKTLRLHPSIRVLADFDQRIDAFDHRLPLYAVSEFMPDQRIGGSVMTPATFGLAVAEDWDRRQALISRPGHTAGYYAMARAEGNGAVRCYPGLKDPVVRYAMTRRDWRLLTEGLARLARVMFAAGARQVFPGITGHPGWRSPGAAMAELGDLLSPKRTNLMTIHMFSSCRMGDAAHCDVDSFGRVKGTENLYIADASLIPEATGVNPQAMVMALARRTATAYLESDGRAGRRKAAGE